MVNKGIYVACSSCSSSSISTTFKKKRQRPLILQAIDVDHTHARGIPRRLCVALSVKLACRARILRYYSQLRQQRETIEISLRRSTRLLRFFYDYQVGKLLLANFWRARCTGSYRPALGTYA